MALAKGRPRSNRWYVLGEEMGGGEAKSEHFMERGMIIVS